MIQYYVLVSKKSSLLYRSRIYKSSRLVRFLHVYKNSCYTIRERRPDWMAQGPRRETLAVNSEVYMPNIKLTTNDVDEIRAMCAIIQTEFELAEKEYASALEEFTGANQAFSQAKQELNQAKRNRTDAFNELALRYDITVTYIKMLVNNTARFDSRDARNQLVARFIDGEVVIEKGENFPDVGVALLRLKLNSPETDDA